MALIIYVAKSHTNFHTQTKQEEKFSRVICMTTDPGPCKLISETKKAYYKIILYIIINFI